MSQADGVLDGLVWPPYIIAGGMQGRRTLDVRKVRTQGGIESRRRMRDRSVRSYDLGLIPREVRQWREMIAIYEVAGASEWGFLFRDPSDSSASGSEGIMRPLSAAGLAIGAAGSGFGVPTYRLAKRYTVQSYSRDVDVRKPESGTIALSRGASPVTIGVSAGNAALDVTTGNVTFVADAQANVNSVTPGATTSVTLASALSGLGIGDRLWLQGLGGADAALLNDASHEITNVATATYTLATNTSGATITASGTGRKYPQASEALAWTGSFYVPVRFEDDDLDWTMVVGDELEDYRVILGPSVRLVEVLIP